MTEIEFIEKYIILCDKDEDLEKEAKENKEKKLNKPKVE